MSPLEAIGLIAVIYLAGSGIIVNFAVISIGWGGIRSKLEQMKEVEELEREARK